MQNATAKHRRWKYARALRRAGFERQARGLVTTADAPVGLPYGMDRATATAVIEVMRSLPLPWDDALLPVNDEWWAYYSAPPNRPLKRVET